MCLDVVRKRPGNYSVSWFRKLRQLLRDEHLDMEMSKFADSNGKAATSINTFEYLNP